MYYQMTDKLEVKVSNHYWLYGMNYINLYVLQLFDDK